MNDQRRIRIGKDGRVSIPANLQLALGIEAGDELLIDIAGDELRLVPRNSAVARAKRLVRSYTDGRTISLVENGLADEAIDPGSPQPQPQQGMAVDGE